MQHIPGFVQDLAQRQRHEFQLRIEALPLSGRKRCQEVILLGILHAIWHEGLLRSYAPAVTTLASISPRSPSVRYEYITYPIRAAYVGHARTDILTLEPNISSEGCGSLRHLACSLPSLISARGMQA